ncbi:Stp1/IreP family PP2C-type Ser/Thr phosphatase, partial [Nostocoides australiense]|nr:Stp1/IreP family PP2C-type Ser/Thr phosphatase [Tetrasphaera australiensis]
MPHAFHYAARSDVGLVRSENQDSGYAGPHLLVVADGMGGHAGGDIASSTAVGYLVELDDESHSANETGDELAQAIATANAEIGRIVAQRPQLHGMGTTITALLRSRHTLAIAHIGDSRAYLLRDGELAQITTDHSFVQTLVDSGKITAEEAGSHPQRSLVTRVLTGSRGDQPDLGAREAYVGDRYLLCSDGLSGFVAADTIADVLRAGAAPEETADRLVELALRAGAPDNVTVIVADIVDMTAGRLPPVTPQIVGAATQSRAGNRALRETPAAKAAALRPTLGLDEESETVERLALAEESSSSRRLLKWLGALAAAVIVIAGGGAALYAWSQRQYFVGTQDGEVAIYQGISSDLGPIDLSTPLTKTGIKVSDLPDFWRTEVESSITADSRDDAEKRVATIRAQAQACIAARAKGQTCGADTNPGASASSSSSSG